MHFIRKQIFVLVGDIYVGNVWIFNLYLSTYISASLNICGYFCLFPNILYLCKLRLREACITNELRNLEIMSKLMVIDEVKQNIYLSKKDRYTC